LNEERKFFWTNERYYQKYSKHFREIKIHEDLNTKQNSKILKFPLKMEEIPLEEIYIMKTWIWNNINTFRNINWFQIFTIFKTSFLIKTTWNYLQSCWKNNFFQGYAIRKTFSRISMIPSRMIISFIWEQFLK
jgi:hypothetical protein